MKEIKAIWQEDRRVFIIDQAQLPEKIAIVELYNFRETVNAIKNMKLRGAGTVGVAAGFAMAQAFAECKSDNELREARHIIEQSRPTAQNLFYSTKRVYDEAIHSDSPHDSAWNTAKEILQKDIANSYLMGRLGARFIRKGMGILTHCNAGKLAIAGLGSALAPIYTAYNRGLTIFVYVDETRPLFQGSRLTAFELAVAGIPHAIIADNAAGYFMETGRIHAVFVGADRIARNGDVANKIGTYEKAVVAEQHNIPFYVVAPTSTIDLDCQTGMDIPIEKRDEKEILQFHGLQIANKDSQAFNPAFDITPARFITYIITEKGIINPSQDKLADFIRNHGTI
jgi:translation initiation factor eIF-2B subunit alpha/methylthioribose-1-phosphate isomerase